MGNKKTNKRMRRAAAFLAALGVLVMSSGLALMVTATPANADPEPKIVVCKYVSTPGGVLQGGNNPIEVSINSLQNAVDDAWLNDPNRTFPKSWGDAQGQGGGSIAIGYAGQGLDISDCPGEEPPPPAVCPEGTDNAGQEIPEGQTAEEFCTDVAPPAAVCAEGTDKAGQEIPAGQAADDFCNVDSTVIVEPPTVVNTPKKHHATTQATVTTPTVVHAGLAGATVQDMRSEQGLALTFAGMVMLVAAGGLGLRVRGSAARI